MLRTGQPLLSICSQIERWGSSNGCNASDLPSRVSSAVSTSVRPRPRGAQTNRTRQSPRSMMRAAAKRTGGCRDRRGVHRAAGSAPRRRLPRRMPDASSQRCSMPPASEAEDHGEHDRVHETDRAQRRAGDRATAVGRDKDQRHRTARDCTQHKAQRHSLRRGIVGRIIFDPGLADIPGFLPAELIVRESCGG